MPGNPYEALESAAADLVGAAGPDALRRLAEDLEAGRPAYAGGAGVGPLPPAAADVAAADAARRLLDAVAGASVAPGVAAAYLRGVAAGYDHRAAAVRTELVWSGPVAFDVPVRATAQVLTGMVREARRELVLTTYSARPYPPLLAALADAAARGVSVWVVVETLLGAGSALQGNPPAQAFAGLSGVALYTWAVDRRPEGAKMHAKLAVADERTLFVGSANLTAGGLDHNIEAGVLVTGGTAARRAAEHLRALRRAGTLVRI
jgi:phosphatidylserine/phosphatidylglycerophosphate/cardiolipin synthase-like enzyme